MPTNRGFVTKAENEAGYENLFQGYRRDCRRIVDRAIEIEPYLGETVKAEVKIISIRCNHVNLAVLFLHHAVTFDKLG